MKARTMQGHTGAGASQPTIMVVADRASRSLAINHSKYCLLALTFLVLTIAIAPAFAQTPIKTLYNTGVDDKHSSLGANGTADPHYQIISGPAGVYSPHFSGGLAYTVEPLPYYWVPPPPGAEWINPADTGSGDPAELSAGTYWYETRFDLCCVNPESVVLKITFAADNNACIRVNNALAGVCTAGGPLYGFLQYTYATIPYSQTYAPFVLGVNKLDFVVTNYIGFGCCPTPTGLLVSITGTGQ